MSKLTCYLLGVLVVAVSVNKAFAISAEDKAILNEFLGPILAECASEHGVSTGEIENAKDSYNADGLKPCFLGCVFKKTQFIDSEGKYQVEKGIDIIKSLVKNKDDFAQFEEVGKICSKVNDVAVSDGDAGCERAKLAIQCAIENKVEMPF